MSSTTTGDTASAMTPGTAAAPAPAADTATTPTSTPASSAPAAAAPAPDHPTTAAKPAPKASGSATGAAQDTGKTTAAKPAAKPSGGAPTAQQIALGDSIFHGTAAGGTCSACHGQDAKGTAVAPNLTDNAWLNGDGSYQFIITTVTNGVPKPKEHPAPMPPKGGAALSDEQVKAVAGYVYSLSHKS